MLKKAYYLKYKKGSLIRMLKNKVFKNMYKVIFLP